MNWRDYDGPFQTLLRAFETHGTILKEFTDDQQHRILLDSLQQTNSQREHLLQDSQGRMNDHFLRYEKDRETILMQGEEQEIERKKTQYLDVIKWLHSPGAIVSPIKYQERFREIGSEFPDTGKWILDEDKIDYWMNADVPTHSILWINGKKGAGKC